MKCFGRSSDSGIYRTGCQQSLIAEAFGWLSVVLSCLQNARGEGGVKWSSVSPRLDLMLSLALRRRRCEYFWHRASECALSKTWKRAVGVAQVHVRCTSRSVDLRFYMLSLAELHPPALRVKLVFDIPGFQTCYQVFSTAPFVALCAAPPVLSRLHSITSVLQSSWLVGRFPQHQVSQVHESK